MHLCGCSPDSLADQAAFAEKVGLRFPLLADEDGAICDAFDVPIDDLGYAARRTAVIVEREVAWTYERVEPAGHAERVLADVMEMLP